MSRPYRECPYCGAHLDPGERCDCQDEEQTIRPGPERTGGGEDQTNQNKNGGIPHERHDQNG